MNHTRRGPGDVSRGRVLRFEPGRERSGVASANGHYFSDTGAILNFELHCLVLDELVQVGESLLRVEVLEVGDRPIGEGLRGAIVAVLEDEEETVEILAHLEREGSV